MTTDIDKLKQENELLKEKVNLIEKCLQLERELDDCIRQVEERRHETEYIPILYHYPVYPNSPYLPPWETTWTGSIDCMTLADTDEG